MEFQIQKDAFWTQKAAARMQKDTDQAQEDTGRAQEHADQAQEDTDRAQEDTDQAQEDTDRAQEHTFRIRKAGRADLDDIVMIMEQVKAGMEHPEWYVTDDRQYLEEHLEKKGFILLAVSAEGKTAGFFIVDFPGKARKNLGRIIHLEEPCLELTAHMDSAAVLAEYRGSHLQSRLLTAAEKELEQYPHQYLMCTVHPQNYASLHTMQRHGYVIVATKDMYGGLKRHILYKKKENSYHKPTVLVSACLLGVLCRYNGGGELAQEIADLKTEAHLVPVCPEIMGGLKTPREPAERTEAGVFTITGEEVTGQYRKGAEEVLKLAELFGCRMAVMKERSPSCGSGRIYDGTHSHVLIDGDGMTSELLKSHGITVFGESEAKKIKDFIEDMKLL